MYVYLNPTPPKSTCTGIFEPLTVNHVQLQSQMYTAFMMAFSAVNQTNPEIP